MGAAFSWFFVSDSILDPGGRPLAVYFTGGGVRFNTLTLRSGESSAEDLSRPASGLSERS